MTITNPYQVVVDAMSDDYVAHVASDHGLRGVTTLCGRVLHRHDIVELNPCISLDKVQTFAVCQDCLYRDKDHSHLRVSNLSQTSVLDLYRTLVAQRAHYISKGQIVHSELEQMDLAAIQEIVNASTLTPTPSVSPVKG